MKGLAHALAEWKWMGKDVRDCFIRMHQQMNYWKNGLFWIPGTRKVAKNMEDQKSVNASNLMSSERTKKKKEKEKRQAIPLKL